MQGLVRYGLVVAYGGLKTQFQLGSGCLVRAPVPESDF